MEERGGRVFIYIVRIVVVSASRNAHGLSHNDAPPHRFPRFLVAIRVRRAHLAVALVEQVGRLVRDRLDHAELRLQIRGGDDARARLSRHDGTSRSRRGAFVATAGGHPHHQGARGGGSNDLEQNGLYPYGTSLAAAPPPQLTSYCCARASWTMLCQSVELSRGETAQSSSSSASLRLT